MNDPYNTVQPETDDTIEFVAPSIEETGRFRLLIDLHRDSPEKYLEQIRDPSRPDTA